MELIRTGESQVHHQENQNVSTGENVSNGALQRQYSENDSNEETEHQQLNKPLLTKKNDNKEKEPLAEDPAHLCSTPMQLDTKDEEDKETIVKPDEEGCIELTSNDANLPQTVSATINAKEPGKTVTA